MDVVIKQPQPEPHAPALGRRFPTRTTQHQKDKRLPNTSTAPSEGTKSKIEPLILVFTGFSP